MRIKGFKLFQKYRKAYLINEYLKSNNNVKNIIADHWKSLEHIKTNKNKISKLKKKVLIKKTNKPKKKSKTKKQTLKKTLIKKKKTQSLVKSNTKKTKKNKIKRWEALNEFNTFWSTWRW